MTDTTVTTELGPMEISLLGGFDAYISTPSGGHVTFRNKPYTLSARFELVAGAWQHKQEPKLNPVQHRDFTRWPRTAAAPTIAAKVIAAAQNALEALLTEQPSALDAAAIAAAQKNVDRAQDKVDKARTALDDAEAFLVQAQQTLAQTQALPPSHLAKL